MIDGAQNGLLSVSEAKRGAEKLRASGYRISREILKNFYVLLRRLEERS